MAETNRIEYKQELTDGLEKEVIAFLNYHEGGVLYIGIDKKGKAIRAPSKSLRIIFYLVAKIII